MPATPGRSSIGVRVRPNANDFIVDLNKQLAAKKKTFYVDVKANLKPANKDVAEWSRVGLKKIRAVIPVGANLFLATKDVAEWRRKQLKNKTNIPIGVNLAKAYAEVLTFRKVAGRDIEINLKVNAETAGRAAERFQAAMGRRGVTLPVHSDVEPARREIDTDLVARLKAGGGIVLPVKADTDSADRDIRTLKTKSRSDIEIQLDLDTKKARLELLLLRLKEKANKLTIEADVKTGALDRFERRIQGITKSFGKISFLRSIGLGPFTLGKPTGLVGTLAAITGLAGAVPGAVTALAALSQALVSLGGAALIVPGALAAIAASIGTLVIGSQGVGDAFSAMFGLWKEGSDKQQTQAKNVTRAQTQFTNAVTDESQAQREVASARREATNDLRNLNNELRGSVLNEAQAILDLQKARDRLAKGGFDTTTDVLQAQVDVAKGEQNVIDVRERNAQLQVKVNDENAKGVEGSDRVTAALENQTRASQATAAAMQAISDTQAAGATSKFNDALAQLSPNAREAVLAVAGLKGPLKDFRDFLQDKIFAGVGPGFLNMFHSLEPIMRTGMGNIADGLNQNILQIFDTLKSPTGQSIIERILGGTAEAQKNFTKFLDPFIRGLGTLMAAGAEHMPQLIDLFTRLATKFSDFIQVADKTGKLDEWMDRGIKALEDIVQIGLNAIKIINDLSNAFGGDLLQTISDLTGKLHTFLSSDQGQKKLKGFIVEAKKLWEDWKPVLEKLPDLFSRISDVATKALNAISPILSGILSALERTPGLVEAFAFAWLGTRVLSGFASVYKLGKVIVDMVSNLGKLPGLLAKIPSALPNTGAIASGGPGAAGASATSLIADTAAGTTAGGAAAVAGTTAAAIVVLGGLVIGANWEGKKAAEAAGKTRDLPIGPHGINMPTKPILPDGVPEPQTPEARAAVQAGVDKNDAAAQWVAAGKDTLDWEKRYVWVVRNPDKSQAGSFSPPDSYGVGGYTDWGQSTGKMALLHGKEYVQPADTVAHYGIKAMEDIHKKRVPKESLAAQKYGFQMGGPIPMADPNYDWSPRNFGPGGKPQRPWKWSDQPQGVLPTQGSGPSTGGFHINPGVPGYVPPWAGGGIGGSAGQDQLNPRLPGFEGARFKMPGFQHGGQFKQDPWWIGPGGPSPVNTGGPTEAPPQGGVPSAIQHGVQGASNAVSNISSGVVGATTGQGTGTAPGPSGGPTLESLLTPQQAPTGNLQSFTIPGLGIRIPIGGTPNPDAKFFGPPADWDPNNPIGSLPEKLQPLTILGQAAEIGIQGVASGLGLDMSYLTAAAPLAQNFIDKAYGTQQDPNAPATNASVASLLDNYYGMPQNPPTGVPGAMPGAPDLSASGAGHKGLQINTARGQAAIQAAFPWATNIGGYSVRPPGTPQWHTKGLALDVMIPGAGGLNDPTPAAGKAQGDALYAWLKAHQAELGIDYILWQEKDHYNHLHVNFSPSGYAPGNDPGAPLVIAPPAAPGTQATKPWNQGPRHAGSHMRGGLVRDQGGWLPPGTSLVHNRTGYSEMILPPDISSFYYGGLNAGMVPPRPPFPRPPDAQQIAPRPPPAPPPPFAPAPMAPPAPPPVGIGAPGPEPGPPVAGIGPATTAPQPGVGVAGPQGGTGVAPSETGDHLNPAVSKGITSGFAAAGNAAAAAASFGLGGMGGGALGGGIAGLFGQAGKIAKNIANVAASFLVGNVTNGTTDNPYGVTQRATNPTGTSRTLDRSTHYHGDLVTNNLDDYFRRQDLRDKQNHQAAIATYDRYA